MVTAWSPLCKPRARSSAGPLRVLWLAALLFGFLYSHGVSSESAAGHLSTSAVAFSAHPAHDQTAQRQLQVSHGHNDDDQGSSHPAEECASGQPQQGPGLSAPSVTPLVGQLPRSSAIAGTCALTVAQSTLPSCRSSASSAVLQV